MGVKYDSGYLKKVGDEAKAVQEGWSKKYAIEVEGGYGLPTMLEAVRALTEYSECQASGTSLSIETKMTVLRHSIQKRKVTILYDGVSRGSFQMNNLADDLDAFEVLRANYPAVLLMMEQVVAHLVEKSMPPTIDSPTQAAGTPGQRR